MTIRTTVGKMTRSSCAMIVLVGTASCLSALDAGSRISRSSSSTNASSSATTSRSTSSSTPERGRTVTGATSHTAAGYNATLALLRKAKAAQTEEPANTLAGHRTSTQLWAATQSLLAAEQTARETLDAVKTMKANGEWVVGLRYRVMNQDGVVGRLSNVTLSEDEVLKALDDMRARAVSGREALAPKLGAAYRREFPHASKAQLAMLDRRGLPDAIEHGKKRGESCWTFETEETSATTCWKKTGVVASHSERKKPPPVVAAEPAESSMEQEDPPAETSEAPSAEAVAEAPSHQGPHTSSGAACTPDGELLGNGAPSCCGPGKRWVNNDAYCCSSGPHCAL